MDSPLQAAYEAYLRSAFGPNESEALAKELEISGLLLEAGALRHHLSRRQDRYIIRNRPWQGCSCEVGSSLPSNPQEGELWFDTVEITPMVFFLELPDLSPDVRGWMAIRPVHVWQFLSFLAVAGPVQRYGGDRFDGERFAKMSSLDPIVDIYGDEAGAYSCWFGKWTVGSGQLMSAAKIFDTPRREMVSPRGLFLCGSQAGVSHLYDVAAFDATTGEVMADEMLDSDSDPTVGVATYVSLKAGLFDSADCLQKHRFTITREVPI